MSTAASPTCYDKDFAQWAFDTARAIRERRFEEIDWDNVAEEIETLGRAEHNELVSRLSQLTYHLLKFEYQPERRGRSCVLSIRAQRNSIYRELRKQPSLRADLRDPEVLSDAYDHVHTLASLENLPTEVSDRFPDECPYTVEMLLPDLDRS